MDEFLRTDKSIESNYERCVICSRKTNVTQEQQINKRVCYVEGVGQLCYECYKETQRDSR